MRKIFPRLPSFRICLNAKYENSEINLTLLFSSETVKKSMKTVATIAKHIQIKIQFSLETEKNLSEISKFSNLPYAKYESLISLKSSGYFVAIFCVYRRNKRKLDNSCMHWIKLLIFTEILIKIS